jgi:8-amino-7-oxononanoate synthase
LANHPEIKKAALQAAEKWGTGSGGSRLLGGTQFPHVELENKLAAFHRAGRALLFNSGYTANFGILQAMGPAFDHILCDRFNHASIIDGLIQSRKPFTRYRHVDMEHLEEILMKQQQPARTLVVTETLFSMEGDFVPLNELSDLQKRYGFFLYLDEAHSTGGYPEFLRPVEKQGYNRTLVMGTFGKALGGFGAFAAGTSTLIEFLVNKCRSFIFTTALPASVTASALAALEVVHRERWRIDKIARLSETVRNMLTQKGFNIGQSTSHIIPVILGENQLTVDVSQYLFDQDIYALPVRPPTVPQGSARLRISLHCEMEDKELGRFVEKLEEAVNQ